MASVNKITLIGNLGADPELRYTPSGKAVANLRLAVNRSWKGDDGEWQEESIWFKASLWEQRAERVAEHMRKGDQVYVEGRLKPVRVYQRNDGTMGTELEVQAHTVLKLGKKERDADEGASGDLAFDDRPQRAEQPPLDVDDIPF